MGFLNKIKMIFLGQGDISANAHTKKITFENDNGVISYKIDGIKYDTLEEIPDLEDREQARRITFK
ncbi:MAG: hypothetical protein IPL26_25310 [Leptospiraceae bacterium]|nr:hypothetical protein [Leptospiraceae bacterium]